MLVQLIGRLFAALPEEAVKALCYLGGALISPWPRGLLVYKNMRMALDGVAEKKLRKLAFEACERTFELGLMAVAGQFFSKERWARTITISTETRAKIGRLMSRPRGLLLLIPHTTLMEALTTLPVLLQQRKRISVLYRAFGSPAIERMILGRREQHGVHLLNRSTGMRKLIHELKDGQIGGLLFDQNSGEFGALTSFMGRIAAASDLPDVVYKHARPIPAVLAIKRTGFWRGEIIIEELKEPKEEDPTAQGLRSGSNGSQGVAPQFSPPCGRGQGAGDNSPLTIQAARWLEKYLRDEKTTTDWLWTHKRWKVLDRPRERLGFADRKVWEIPVQKKTKFFIRLPNWLGDVVMALPVLRALRMGRPDAEIALLCRSAYIPLLQKLHIADRVLGLPIESLKSFIFCAALRGESPDLALAFTNSLRGDIEMLMTGAWQRFGLKREGYWRPLLTHGYGISNAELVKIHQSHLWEDIFKHFGLKAEVSYEPFALPTPADVGQWDKKPIGFVPCSSNMPEKRYPAELWQELAQKLNRPIVLFGTPSEQVVTSLIAKDLPFVTDLAGKTDMASLAENLAACSLVIGNDTGAMHLANALGVPTLVIYGPTFPERTHPIFNAAYHQIKAASGKPIGSISPEEIYRRVKRLGLA